MTNSVPSEGSDPQKDSNHPEGSWEAIRKWFGKYRSQVLFFLGGLALYLLLGLFLWWLLQLYVDPNSIKDPSKEATAKKDLLQALGFIMAGVAGAIGIYFTWRGQRLTQESTQEELRITREGQITERFTRAIDQLGKVDDKGKKLFEIRVGGIYALERIARESDEDYWPIMEVLTAYVRQHAPRRLPEEGQDSTEEAAVEKKAEDGSSEESRSTELPAPTPDIQAIMTVIRRRTRSYGHGEPEPLDLHATNLLSTNLGGADLSEANLQGANLSEANLQGANLTGAELPKADLSGANLSEAGLSEANLQGANLSGANLTRAYLSRAYLWYAVLSGANLMVANLPGAKLHEADLSRATLWGAKLPKADLSGANLSGVWLQGANLSGADLTGANLQETGGVTAEIEENGSTRIETWFVTDVQEVYTDLSKDYPAAEMITFPTQEQINQAKGDGDTQLPPHLKPPAHWGVKMDEQSKGD